MRLGTKFLAAMALAALVSTPLSAKPKAQEAAGNALIQGLAACRGIAEETARLACYDAASGRLADAVERKELVFLDRQEVSQTRRSLFGFSMPNIPFLRDGGAEESEIETTIASATSLGQGKWQIRLEDGAVWQTNETWLGLSDPRPRQKIVIRRGALGNYFLRINGQRGLRGRRIS